MVLELYDTKDFKELCLSPCVKERNSEVNNKTFIPEQQSHLCFVFDCVCICICTVVMIIIIVGI